MTSQNSAANTAAEGADAPIYTTVRVSRTVDYMDFKYKPGRDHHVDAETLAALGDAVIKPANPGA
jgi:hypothetical protein